MIETIRLSKQARDQLVRLKRVTGVTQWNILCRWALCMSLAEPDPPRMQAIPGDSAVEMTWRTFAGPNESVYRVLLRQRCQRDGITLEDDNLATQFRLHLHRGISYLAGDRVVSSIAGLVGRAVPAEGRK